jgi:prepilin-type N-terminal cleavage/methylation domain-containing protein
MTMQTHRGYTLIEVLVAIVLAGLLFVGLFSSLSNILSITAGSSQRQQASNLAYSNMRLYADGDIPLWFHCDTADQTAALTLMSSSGNVDGLPGTVTQTVEAVAPYGCDANKKGYPVVVTSSVELSNGIKADHATYTTF